VTRAEEWRSLAERILAAAREVFEAADIAENARDPRLLALTLLARTVGNFEGALSELSNNRIVESRTLVRCCWENLFWTAALAKKGDEFVQKVIADDAFSRHRRGKRLLQWSKTQASPRDFERKLEEFLEDYEEKNPDKAAIQHATAADVGAVKGGYIIYGELSTDAAHPSAVSLDRHADFDETGNEFTLRARPEVVQDEVEQTLEFGCSATLGVAVAANQILGFPVKLNDLAEEFQALSNKSKS
jgi:hypothetical protein